MTNICRSEDSSPVRPFRPVGPQFFTSTQASIVKEGKKAQRSTYKRRRNNTTVPTQPWQSTDSAKMRWATSRRHSQCSILMVMVSSFVRPGDILATNLGAPDSIFMCFDLIGGQLCMFPSEGRSFG